MPQSRFRHAFVALLLLVALLAQGTWALAGTTGSLNGTLTNNTNGTPIADATVTVSSPSESATTKTDGSGHFTFLNLAPDSYTVSAEKTGFTPVSVTGIAVFADQAQTLTLSTGPQLQTIARVVSRSAGNLVKPGTTSDVYSVNAATQQTLSSVGGGYNMNQAYSAIYSQPGVSSIIGNYGAGQVFYIRGASYGQTGYEFDGVPVNRAFDNYNGNSLSNLGQQELQVYTGGSPASGSSATLGGYINQVIKTGTYPGTGTATLGVGDPTFYHQLMVEAGGATPNRMFSYYVGLGGYNQEYRTLNNQNGGNLDNQGMGPYGLFGTEGNIYAAFNTGFYGNGGFPSCPNLAPPANGAGYPVSGLDGATPMCVGYGTFAAGYQTSTADREAVVNLHFGIQHKNDGGKDDVQLLWDSSGVHSVWADSINDLGGLGAYQNLDSFLSGITGTTNLATNTCWITQHIAYGAGYSSPNCANGGGSPFAYQDGYIFAPGTQFGNAASSAKVIPYYFPNSPSNRQLYAGIPTDQRDAVWNDTGIVKLQYTKNFNSNSYARVYGYSFYSDWMQSGPNEASLYYGLAGFGFGASGDYPSPDYELYTHTRGFSFEYANQINDQNTLQFTANYVTAGLNRFNNQTWLANSLLKTSTNLVDASGNCYNYKTGAIGSCFSSSTSGTYGDPTRSVYCSTHTCVTPANASWEVTQPGGHGTLNNVTPKFTTFSLSDEFRPNSKLDLNLGVRMERYQYDLTNSNTPMNNFWFNAASNVYCYDPVTLQPILSTISANSPPPAAPITTNPGAPCPIAPSGQQGLHPNGQNGALLFSAISAPSFAYNIFSPRIGGTYTFNPDTVFRFTVGRYTQPTPAAY
ncbi:MAG TPA: carboxypeptidase regulatory-like domain-containing protein, partial [Candidatus Baltobacteraceae bacterium]|nr:carboxypeptidase regulatory-like domain-containing protein [Candidatus Baltobacteraceae bacterium]